METSPNKKNVISISQIGTIVAQLRTEMWYSSQNIFILSPHTDNRIISLYMVASINSVLRRTFSPGYSNYPTLTKLQALKIVLPTKNQYIDFDFIEGFIAELEEERIAELEEERIAELDAYLFASGLNQYELTKDEEKALKSLENCKWKDVLITDIADIHNTKNILSRSIIENSGVIPYLGAGTDNNSIISYVNYDTKFLDKGNCVFIGGKTFVVTYQEKDFFSNDSHNLAIYFKENKLKDKVSQLFLVTCLRCSLQHLYSWGDSVSNKKIRKDKVRLPFNNEGQIDYEIMKSYISAIQKIVIKDMVVWKDKVIDTTQHVVNNK